MQSSKLNRSCRVLLRSNFNSAWLRNRETIMKVKLASAIASKLENNRFWHANFWIEGTKTSNRLHQCEFWSSFAMALALLGWICAVGFLGQKVGDSENVQVKLWSSKMKNDSKSSHFPTQWNWLYRTGRQLRIFERSEFMLKWPTRSTCSIIVHLHSTFLRRQRTLWITCVAGSIFSTRSANSSWAPPGMCYKQLINSFKFSIQ